MTTSPSEVPKKIIIIVKVDLIRIQKFLVDYFKTSQVGPANFMVWGIRAVSKPQYLCRKKGGQRMEISSVTEEK